MTLSRHLNCTIAAAACAIALAACGGGGDSGASPQGLTAPTDSTSSAGVDVAKYAGVYTGTFTGDDQGTSR